MRYKLTDNITSNHVYWLLEDIKHGLKTHPYFKRRNCNWEITYQPIDLIKTMEVGQFKKRKELYETAFERGDIFPPVIIKPHSWVPIDGAHKYRVLQKLGAKVTAVAKGASNGDKSEIIKDNVYTPMLKDHPIAQRPLGPKCISCGTILEKKEKWSCPNCKHNIDSPIVGWTLVNLPTSET